MWNRLLVMMLMLFTATSCMTVKRIQRNCDVFAKICAVDVLHEVRYRDTIIYLNPIQARLPVSDIKIVMQLEIEAGEVVDVSKVVKTSGLITAEAWVENGKLHVNSYLNDSTILVKPDPVVIKDAIKTEQLTRTVPVRYIPAAYRFAFWFIITEILILMAYLLLKKTGKGFKDILTIILSKI